MAAALLVAATATAAGVVGGGGRNTGGVSFAAMGGTGQSMMGGTGQSMMGGTGYPMMGGTGHPMMGDPGQPSTAQGSSSPGGVTPKATERVTLVVRSDTEHGRRGPNGAWHDAFLPANLTVRAGRTVAITVVNYDDMPHSFSSASLAVNETIASGSSSHPSRTTFTVTAPHRAGRYLWWCALPCDPFSMSRIGYMRGYVRVLA